MKLNKDKGFTLIEIIVAMSIISLIAMAFFTIVNTSIKGNTKNEQDIKALHIAQTQIENLRLQIKKGIDIVESKPYSSDGYTITSDITEINPNLYEIKVSVESGDKSFSKKRTKLITQVFGK